MPGAATVLQTAASRGRGEAKRLKGSAPSSVSAASVPSSRSASSAASSPLPATTPTSPVLTNEEQRLQQGPQQGQQQGQQVPRVEASCSSLFAKQELLTSLLQSSRSSSGSSSGSGGQLLAQLPALRHGDGSPGPVAGVSRDILQHRHQLAPFDHLQRERVT